MIKKLLTILFILGLTVNAYAVKEYAQRYPTGTAIEVYNSVNTPPAVTLDSLSDVNTSGVTTNDTLIFNGTSWVKGTITPTETDPVVKAITGLVKSNGSTISAASAGTDYQVPGSPISVTVANAGNSIGVNITQNDVTNNPAGALITNAGTGNALKIDQNGATSSSTSTGGAMLLENTGNTGAGIIIYSNLGATASGRLMNIRADNADFDEAALHIDYDGTANAFEIVNSSTDSSANAISVTSTNENDTAVGISGQESGKGTVKITHNKSSTSDAAASALSIYLAGAGTAAQGLFIDTVAGGTSGKLLNIRSAGSEVFTVTNAGLGTFAGGLTLPTGTNLIVGANTLTSGDLLDATKVANADLGELGVSSGVWSVENAAVIGKVITGFSSGAGALAGTDTILQAIQKLDGNVGTKQTADADLTTWAGITPGANVGTFLATPSSANLFGAITDETGTGVAVFNNSPTFADDVQLGLAGATGILKLYSEQGATDYTASLYPNTAMTSAASFYLPADEPAADSFLTMTTGGVMGFVSKTGGITLANTAMTAGRSLTISTNDVAADAELYTDTKCIYWENPVATDDFKSIWMAKQAATITSMWAESDQTVNLDLQVDDGSPADVNGTDISPAAGTAEDTSLSGDTTMAAGDRLDLAITSVSGTPTWCSVCWTFTYDD